MTSQHDKYAQDYDKSIVDYECYIADVLFGLCYEYIQAGEKVLDVGIGTGISSQPFHKAGMKIYGIDGSKAMLDICRQKGIAQELIEQDVLSVPWSYQNNTFEHVISCGLFHFIEKLESVIEETARIQKNNGIFAFTVMKAKDEQVTGIDFEKRIEDDIDIYAHKMAYIKNLLEKNRYKKEKETITFIGNDQHRVIVARKMSGS